MSIRALVISLLRLTCLTLVLVGNRTVQAQYRFDTWGIEDGLPGRTVFDALQSYDGYLWLTTPDGLVRFDGVRFKIFNTAKGLKTNRLGKLAQGSDGSLWISTTDSGVIRLNDGKFITYTTADGLPHNSLKDIKASPSGGILMLTFEGLIQWKDEQFLPYLTNDRLFVPYLHAVIDPKAITINTLPPPVVVEDFILDHEPVSFRDRVEILPGKSEFEIHYAALSFIRPEYIRFKYQLVGLDNDWVDAGTRRIAYYNHVPPGEYTFKVIAANSDGKWNTAGAQIRISVVPPFWRTNCFIALACLLIAAAVALAFELRVSWLRRAHEVQEAFSRQLIEAHESERKRIAAELHDSLGQQLLIIKNWALLCLNTLPGDARAKQQVNEISVMASRAIEEVREISYNLRPYLLDELGLTRAIKSLLDRVSDSSGINFMSEIDQLDGAFRKEAEINFYRIVQEGVNNIIKHSRATRAKLTINRDGHSVRLILQDNGKGFDSETGYSGKSARQGGFGLTGIAERARMLGGNVAIQSVPGQGTTITLSLNSKDK